MSNIAYFTTSPAMLMRRWQASSATTTTSTTTTTTCGIYSIDIYAQSNGDCQLGADCDCNFFPCGCTEPHTLTLEYSHDSGSNWYSTSIDLSTVDKNCTYIDTFTYSTCETSLIFRIVSDKCGCEVYFNWTDSSTCPGPENNKCNDCTELATSDVVGSSFDLSFTICTTCNSGTNCCEPCCGC